MRYIFFCTFFLFVSTLNAQRTPTLLIDGTPVKFQGDLSLPYWVSAGKTIAFSVDAISASILEFNIDSNELQFNQVMHLTTSGTVPAGKAWKIEAIGLGPNSADIPTSGFSTTAAPEIFTSPVTFSTPGTYSWIVPPGITNICVEAWGGGGAGGNGTYPQYYSGGGGGGGGYGYDCFAVVPGSNYTITVGSEGQLSSVGSLIAATGGSGGTSASSTAQGVSGLGGSSAATFNINGADGAGRDGGTGANGGRGGEGSTGATGDDGSFPGGGGGGGGTSSSYQSRYGGDGADGQVIIYF
jgi:hypothetical protein